MQAIQPTMRPLPLHFHPSLWSTLLVALLLPVFIALGNWQLGKAQAKTEAQARLDSQRLEAPVELSSALIGDPAALHLRSVSARGSYDPSGQILIDNRVLHGRAGFHVLTPLRIEGGETRVLVNRGWLPAPADRRQVTTVDTPVDTQVVTGTAVVPSTKFFALAPDTATLGGSAIWQNLDLARYRKISPHPLQPIVIQLDPQSPAGGFDRDWPRLDERRERHLGYAYQWYGFALTALAIWLYFACRRREAGR